MHFFLVDLRENVYNINKRVTTENLAKIDFQMIKIVKIKCDFLFNIRKQRLQMHKCNQIRKWIMDFLQFTGCLLYNKI